MQIKRKHDEIEAMYRNGSTTKEIANKFDITSRGVLYVLHKRNVPIKGKRRTGGRRVDVDFFKTWTNEMAYVLGFVFTDGNVHGNTLSIAQNERYILEEINRVMDSNFEIRRRPNGKNDIHVLAITRKEIIDDLKRLGISEGKSRIMEFPEVPAQFLPHFIRGVIDGDGWVQDRGYVMNVTNASKNFSESLHDIFNSRGLNGRITEQNNAYRVWVSGKQDVINLAEWIYKDCGDLYLRRKFERFYVNKKTPKQSPAS